MAELQILIADDHASVRRSIRLLLESHAGWSVCSEVSNGRQAVQETRRLKPDIILLDVSMPELDGLQATREILKSDPDAQVLILTIHDSKAIEEQAALAGAKAVFSKSAAHETLVAGIEALARNLIRLAGSHVGLVRHIAAFFHSEAERYRVLGPFIAEGLARGQKAIHIIDAADRAAHIGWLQRSEVDLLTAEEEGMALLVDWQDIFSGQRMVEEIHRLLRDASSEGFPITRLIGFERPRDGKLAEWESRLNYFLPSLDDIVLCAYDLKKFDGVVIVDIIRCHPAILIGETFHRNPFYVPPDEMIRQLGRRQRSDELAAEA